MIPSGVRPETTSGSCGRRPQPTRGRPRRIKKELAPADGTFSCAEDETICNENATVFSQLGKLPYESGMVFRVSTQKEATPNRHETKLDLVLGPLEADCCCRASFFPLLFDLLASVHLHAVGQISQGEYGATDMIPTTRGTGVGSIPPCGLPWPPSRIILAQVNKKQTLDRAKDKVLAANEYEVSVSMNLPLSQ